MSRSEVFENVSRKRLAGMKAIMRRRIASYARNNGYEIQTWIVPEGVESVWHITLKNRSGVKPKLDFMARVSHDLKNKRLTIELIRMPFFITRSSALAQVQSVYKASRP
ncbi:MAG: hypothetical protein ACOX0F_03775 [Syntrophomonadaceae bacterium]